jgi:hypothetical protein
MQEPHRKGVANHSNPESCAGGGNIAGEALTAGTRSPAIELQPPFFEGHSHRGHDHHGLRQGGLGSFPDGCSDQPLPAAGRVRHVNPRPNVAGNEVER